MAESDFDRHVREISDELLARGAIDVEAVPAPPVAANPGPARVPTPLPAKRRGGFLAWLRRMVGRVWYAPDRWLANRRQRAAKEPAGDAPVASAPPAVPGRPDALDRDPQGMVTKYRGLYLRALGRDPRDENGLVAKLRAGSIAIEREAERRRLIRDSAATKATWDAIRAGRHGRFYEFWRAVWYGIPFTGAPELFYPDLGDEDALTRGEWFEWAANHRMASAESMIDHLASIIPPKKGESYEQWRNRLKGRRESWRTETDRVVVNRSLYAQPPPAEPRSPGKSNKRAARTARRPRARRDQAA